MNLIREFIAAVVFGTYLGFAVGFGMVAIIYWDEWRAYRRRVDHYVRR